jgi:dimethylaniline monooxygenase (N-oxide forming)
MNRLEDIDFKRKAMRRRYFQSDKHTLQVDFISYMDELAELVGCKPPLLNVSFLIFLKSNRNLDLNK